MEKDSKDEKSEKSKKVFLTQRLFAYFVDTFIVLLVASLIASPFINVNKINKLEKEYYKVVEKVLNNSESSSKYNTDIINIGYDIAVQNGMLTIIKVIVGVLYFVVLQIKLGGQTIGKKIARIKVVSTEGDLTYNQMIFRSFIANSLLLDIITILLLMFTSRDMYYSGVVLFTSIQYLITIVSLIMILSSNSGLAVHDKIVHTKVINVR